MLKPILDRNFALGINKVFFHIFVHNPYLNKAPGTTLDGIGLYFQRDQTWWKQGKAFVDYVARCQTLLQYGHPVTDIAVFTGEEFPRRALTPDKLVPLLPGIVGKERVESEQKRLANIGQPMREMPAGVNHSANILKAEDWVNPLNGYAYDSFNKDALLRLAKGENGQMKLQGEAEYKVVIFPNGDKYSNETLAAMDQLRQAGVAIPVLPVQTNLAIEPDVLVPKNVAWTHRRGENTDIYFISNQENIDKCIVASFRVEGKNPQLWNAVTGQISTPTEWKSEQGRTQMKLNLSASESVFVVFENGNSISKTEPTTEAPTAAELKANWNVTFLSNKQSVDTDKLFDWSKSENPLIKYYSGTAIYKTNFNNASKSKSVCLNLGKLSSLATVRVNGIDCGTVWTAPYQVDVTKALERGINTLEIEVCNTWANAINGSDKRTPPFPGIWTNGKYRMSEDKLMESGLIGPVTIIQR